MPTNFALFPFPFFYKPKANCYFTGFIDAALKMMPFEMVFFYAQNFYVKSHGAVLDSVEYVAFFPFFNFNEKMAKDA